MKTKWNCKAHIMAGVCSIDKYEQWTEDSKYSTKPGREYLVQPDTEFDYNWLSNVYSSNIQVFTDAPFVYTIYGKHLWTHCFVHN